jgi:hypothetical protein
MTDRRSVPLGETFGIDDQTVSTAFQKNNWKKLQTTMAKVFTVPCLS